MSNSSIPEVGGRSAKFALILLVIVYVFNFIDRQIKSILSQKNIDLDLFISDDKSEDRTLEICKKFSKTNKNIFILENKNYRFKSAAKNFLLMNKISN